jgi:hypothetical protein
MTERPANFLVRRATRQYYLVSSIGGYLKSLNSIWVGNIVLQALANQKNSLLGIGTVAGCIKLLTPFVVCKPLYNGGISGILHDIES